MLADFIHARVCKLKCEKFLTRPFIHRLGRPEKDAGLAEEIRQQLHRYENLLKRQFQTDRPNHKWVTDISYIHTKQGVLYLSMIRDLYHNSIVAYKTGTEQTINLVLDTVHLAMRREKRGPLQSYNSTVTKAFNTHPKHISS